MTEIDLFGPEFFADPYPTYARMRAERPVHWDERAKRWFITRHADIVAATAHPGISAARVPSPERLEAMGLGVMEPVYGLMRRQMNFIDAPEHTRIRGLVHKAFTPAALAALRGHVQEITDSLLDAAGEGAVDLMRDFAYPLPAIVIAEMLGVPPEDRDRFKQWSADFAEIVGNPMRPMERLLEIRKSALQLVDYLRTVVAGLRASPGDNIMSALAQVEEKGEALTEEDLLANAVFLLVAGHETTTNLIANGVLTLLRWPAEMQRLRDEPALIASAVEEILRFESPLQMVGRIAKEDIEIGGVSIGRGQVIALVLGSANRDPACFSEPDRLDLGRRDNRHLAFSQGAHYCIGAALARMEGAVAIGSLLERYERITLQEGALSFHHNLSFRGLRSLPVSLEGRSP